MFSDTEAIRLLKIYRFPTSHTLTLRRCQNGHSQFDKFWDIPVAAADPESWEIISFGSVLVLKENEYEWIETFILACYN